jgi:hypothetical protein
MDIGDSPRILRRVFIVIGLACLSSINSTFRVVTLFYFDKPQYGPFVNQFCTLVAAVFATLLLLWRAVAGKSRRAILKLPRNTRHYCAVGAINAVATVMQTKGTVGSVGQSLDLLLLVALPVAIICAAVVRGRSHSKVGNPPSNTRKSPAPA